MSILRRALREYALPLLARPARVQMAALCYRLHDERLEVLLITSLDTGRWIIPKGWPMKGREASECAAIEAWEEAGVVARQVNQTPIGSFRYGKRVKGGAELPCETMVFAIEVANLADDFPHRGKRERRWMAPNEAARLIQEPDLREILTTLPQRMAL